MTQKDLAKELGITVSWLSKIENGKQIPNMSLAVRLAFALHCKVDDLFYN
jgi:DNA-binding XRE family transcriptional regulator